MIVHSGQEASVPTEQTDKPVVGWQASAAVVRDVLAGQRVDDMDRDAVMIALAYGLIESREQTKPCAMCGTERFDFRYWRVTGAGRLLAQAFEEATTTASQAQTGHEAEGEVSPNTPKEAGE